jgi:hypothetical protein
MDSLNTNPDTDPDPTFQVDPDYQKLNKDLFLIKNCNLLMSKQQEKPSALKKEHRALQKMKFINIFYVCGSFFPFRIPLNLDPIWI